MKREKEYLKRMRTKSVISEKAYQEAFKSGAASLRWQDSVKQFKFNENRLSEARDSMNTSLGSKAMKSLGDTAVTMFGDKEKFPSITSKQVQVNMTLFLVLLPKGGEKHSPIYSKTVRIISQDFHSCDDVDFLKLCCKIFNQTNELNYIYNQDGKIVEKLSEI